jgi:putative hydrolase of the HAD superfamily
MKKDLSKVKAVLFDLDNTLMDFTKMKEEAVDAAVDAMIDAGLPLGKQDALKKIKELYKKRGIEYQRVFDDFLKKVMKQIDYKILAAGIIGYRAIKDGYVKPFPNVVTVLLELRSRGFKLGIVSDAPAIQAWTRLVGMKLHYYFDFVITLKESRVGKPGRVPFEVAMGRLKLKPNEFLMVGDNPTRDIAGANKIGMVSVLAKYCSIFKINPKKPEETPDYEINDIKELLNLLPGKMAN